MKRAAVPSHDMALYAELFAKAKWIDANVREGKMFGCPAIFLDKKMALCVMRSTIGMKVPEAVANAARAHEDVSDFQPFGKPRMREWIEIPGTEAAMSEHAELLVEAITYAERLNGG